MKDVLDKVNEAYDILMVAQADVVKQKEDLFDLKKQLGDERVKLEAKEKDVNARARIVGNIEDAVGLKDRVDYQAKLNIEVMNDIVAKKAEADKSIVENRKVVALIKEEREVASAKIRSLKAKELEVNKKIEGLKSGLLAKLAKEIG